MKKLILSAAIILGSFTGFAQETEEAPVQEATTTETAAPAAEEVFTAVDAAAIPAPVTAALEVAYPGATISTAEVNEAKEYKLMVKAGEQEGILYSDAEGNWIEK
jgi:hypothetical protein